MIKVLMCRKLMFYKVANNGTYKKSKLSFWFILFTYMSLEAKLCFSLMCHIWYVGKNRTACM